MDGVVSVGGASDAKLPLIYKYPCSDTSER